MAASVLKAPSVKKQALFVGNLRHDMSPTQMEEFVQRRCGSVSHTAKVYQCSFLSRETTDHSPAAAHLVVDQHTADLVLTSTFWPRPVYVRPWRFKPPREINQSPPCQEDSATASFGTSPGTPSTLRGEKRSRSTESPDLAPEAKKPAEPMSKKGDGHRLRLDAQT